MKRDYSNRGEQQPYVNRNETPDVDLGNFRHELALIYEEMRRIREARLLNPFEVCFWEMR